MTEALPSRFRGLGGHQSNVPLSEDWITPRWLIERLGPFDLDPCASKMQPWPTATHHFTVDDDGLKQSWDGEVWLNPPYGRETWMWMSKLAYHGTGIALIFARTETAGFFAQVWAQATSLLFIKGRLDFHRPDGSTERNAGAPSVLVAYGWEANRRLATSRIPGAFVHGWNTDRGTQQLFD